jgi:geranylgeranyl pyrophosphate synthase
LNSLPSDYSDGSATKVHTKPYFHDYEWFYCIRVVHYANQKTDTIISYPGEKTKVLHDVVRYECWTKIMDNWMTDYKRGLFLNDWMPTWTGAPKDTERKLLLRKIDEFTTPQQLIVKQSLKLKKGHRTRDYFTVMRNISKEVDYYIASILQQTDYYSLNQLLNMREGKPKLRPMLTYAASQCFSNNKPRIELLSLQDAQSMALYCDNWIIDGKRSLVQRSTIAIAGARFRLATEQLIASMQIPQTKQKIFRKKFHESNELSYQGQLLEVSQLTSSVRLQIESEYLETYFKRCRLLNSPYGFSLWSGGFFAGASAQHLNSLWNIGIELGAGLQILNDLQDMHPQNPAQFADLHAGRITLPYYLQMRGFSKAAIHWHANNYAKQFAEKAELYTQTLPEGEGKSFILHSISMLTHKGQLT